MAFLLPSSVASVGGKRVIIKKQLQRLDRRVVSVTRKGNELCSYQLLALLKTRDKREVGQDIHLQQQQKKTAAVL